MNQSKEIIDSIFGSAVDSDDDDAQPNVNSSINNEIQLTELRDDMVDVGGNRGLFALCPLPPGIMVVSEVPTVTWGGERGIISLDDPDNLAHVVELCCCNPEAYVVTQALHPRSLSDCDEIELTKVQELLPSSVVTHIVQVAGHIVDHNEVYRVVLVLQHNGFGSGLYRYLTMLNHSCNPNCVKYSPSPGSFGASEIWTVRPVKTGEELTISYCEPLELTRSAMHEFLTTHHRFHCRCSYCLQSNPSDSIPTVFIATMEKITQQEERIQQLVIGMEHEYQFWLQAKDLDGILEILTKLLRSTTGMAAIESERQDISLSPRILARLHRLAANTAAAFLDVAGNSQQHHPNKRPKRDLLKESAFSFLRNSLCLLSEQLKYLDPKHPEIARAYIDIAVALECALDTFPDELMSACNASISSETVNRKHDGGIGGSNDHGAGSRVNGSGSGSGVSDGNDLDGGTKIAGGGINGADIGSDGNEGGVTILSVVSSFPELKLLNFVTLVSKKGGTAENPGLAPAGITKKMIRDEIKRFRTTGSQIKRLYSRSLFPALYRDLQGQIPGACHWGCYIPLGHTDNDMTTTSSVTISTPKHP